MHLEQHLGRFFFYLRERIGNALGTLRERIENSGERVRNSLGTKGMQLNDFHILLLYIKFFYRYTILYIILYIVQKPTDVRAIIQYALQKGLS
jgi:hypothetical protein